MAQKPYQILELIFENFCRACRHVCPSWNAMDPCWGVGGGVVHVLQFRPNMGFRVILLQQSETDAGVCVCVCVCVHAHAMNVGVRMHHGSLELVVVS